MKKIKTYLIAFIVGLSAFVMFGITVDAAAGTADNFKIVCDPAEASKNEPTSCWIVAQVKGGNIYGVRGKITEMNKLVFNETSGSNGSKGVFGANSNIIGEFLSNGQTSKTNSAVKCENEQGCVFFLSKTNTASIEESTEKSAMAGTSYESEYKNYTKIGYLSLKIAQDADVSNCGEICISFTVAQTSTDVDKFTGAGSACQEIKPKGTTTSTSNSNTGSFASYAVLAAGAFIAISAIAIAKKHNKFYRV
ncbi:MAG: hypothetical protein ACI4WW_06955 [Candidatus Coprovivens sp.]